MMKRAKLFSRTLPALFLAAVLAFTPLCSLGAHAVTQDEIDKLKEELAELEAQGKAQQEVIDQLTDARALIVERKEALDKKIEITQRQIDVLNNQITLYDEILGEKESELLLAQEAESNQVQLLRARMRAMEESGDNSLMAYIFQADSVTDLLARLADVNDIMHYDQVLEADYTAAREDVQVIRDSYEEMLAKQEAISREMDRRTEELNAQTEAASALIAELNEQSDNAQAEFDAIADARAKGEAELNALIKKKQEEEEAARRAAAAAAAAAASGQQSSGGSSGGGTGSAVSLSSLMWPVPSCNIITSRFGYRTSPTAGASSYHGGLDIGASAGAAIVAAQKGTVILASSISGYGNTVMIDHGGGVVTLYGHMSSISVSYGQKVSQGQTIGKVGSTGISTGPHCHFEIRVNGSQTNPAPYFSGLVYYC